MKVVHQQVIFDHENFFESELFKRQLRLIVQGIELIKWPTGHSEFTIRPVRHGSGVVPIKNSFISYMVQCGWSSEASFVRGNKTIIQSGTSGGLPGKYDLSLVTQDGRSIVIEWETGNISSSHRSVNRMMLGMLYGQLRGGVLILPTRALYGYLTDRIGNYEELVPYFDLWRTSAMGRGFLAILSVQHDKTDTSVSLIPKGTDGNARRARRQ